MKRIAIAALAVLLALSLVACDDMVQFMGKMGQSVAGPDLSKLDDVTSSTKVDADERDKAFPPKSAAEIAELDVPASFGAVDSAFGLDLFGTDIEKSVAIITGGDKSAILIDGYAVELDRPVSSMLPPVDLTDTISMLTGAAKEATVEALKGNVEDEDTLNAAKGTATVLASLLGKAVDEETAQEPGMAEFIESLNNMADPDSEITMGDVLVLQAATSMVAGIGNTVIDIVDENGGTEQMDTNQLMGEISGVMDEASSFVTIISSASEASAMGTGFLALLDGLIK